MTGTPFISLSDKAFDENSLKKSSKRVRLCLSINPELDLFMGSAQF